MTWRGDKIVDISRDFLNTNGVTQHADAVIALIPTAKETRVGGTSRSLNEPLILSLPPIEGVP